MVPSAANITVESIKKKQVAAITAASFNLFSRFCHMVLLNS